MKTRKTLIIVAAIVSLIALILVSQSTVAYTDYAYLCEYTGSQKYFREWRFGPETNHVYKESKLEVFIKKHYPSELEHKWVSYAGTGKNIFGRNISFGHGRPAYYIVCRGFSEFQNLLGGLNNEEMRELMVAFRTGDWDTIEGYYLKHMNEEFELEQALSPALRDR